MENSHAEEPRPQRISGQDDRPISMHIVHHHKITNFNVYNKEIKGDIVQTKTDITDAIIEALTVKGAIPWEGYDVNECVDDSSQDGDDEQDEVREQDVDGRAESVRNQSFENNERTFVVDEAEETRPKALAPCQRGWRQHEGKILDGSTARPLGSRPPTTGSSLVSVPACSSVIQRRDSQNRTEISDESSVDSRSSSPDNSGMNSPTCDCSRQRNRRRSYCYRDCNNQTYSIPTYDSETQTSTLVCRDRMGQTDDCQTYDTEAQTDKLPTRGRECQTYTFSTDSDTQTHSICSTMRSFSSFLRTNKTDSYSQTIEKVFANKKNQTKTRLKACISSQTATKTIKEKESQTDSSELRVGSTQTDETISKNSQKSIPTIDCKFDTILYDGFKIATKNSDEDKTAREFLAKYFEESDEITSDCVKEDRVLFDIQNAFWSLVMKKTILKCFERHHKTSNEENAAWIQFSVNLVSSTLMNKQHECQIRRHVHRVNDVINVAKEYVTSKKYLHAVVLFYGAAKLHQLDSKGDQSVFSVRECIHRIRLTVKLIVGLGQTNIVLDHVMPLLDEIMEFLKSVEGASHKVHVEMEACGLFCKALCYYFCEKHQQYADTTEAAIDILLNGFKEDVDKHHVYGLCLLNAGVAYEKMNQIDAAITRYEKALAIYQTAIDWGSECEKAKAINVTKSDLKIAERKLVKD